MTAEVEEDGLGLAALPALLRLVDGGADGVVGLWRRQDGLGLGEAQAGGEGLQLGVGPRGDIAMLGQVADLGGHAVVAQAAGMEARGDEGGAQGVHLYQGREVGGVAKVVGELALGQGRAGGGLDGDELHVATLAQLLAEEGER